MIKKHKLLKEYHYTTPEKKIMILKSGVILEDYKYNHKGDFVKLESEIVISNPEYFEMVTWQQELINLLRQSKIPQPGIITKKISPFIEEYFILKGENSQNMSDDLKLEYERKIRRLESKEMEIKEDLIILEKKENELRIRNKELSSKEDELLEKEIEIKRKELTINNNLLTHDDFKNKMNEEIEKFSIKEKEFNQKIKNFENLKNNDLDLNYKRYDELKTKLNSVREFVDQLLKNKYSIQNQDVKKISELLQD